MFLGSLHGASSFSSISGGGLLLSTGVRISKKMYTPTLLQESTYNNEDIMAKKDTARAALLKLLQNQRKSLQETEELIRNLEDDNSPVGGSKPNAITQTVLSGVNYGFVSRSEGSASSAYDLTNEIFDGDASKIVFGFWLSLPYIAFRFHYTLPLYLPGLLPHT